MAGKIFYATTAAGAIFIAIGIASSIYSNVPVQVPLDYVIRPGVVDDITPDMNAGGVVDFTLSGSSFDVSIADPDGKKLLTESGNSTFSHRFAAEKSGEYRIVVTNTGNSDLTIDGTAETKSDPLGLTGALMLIVTGVIVIGLGLRFRRS